MLDIMQQGACGEGRFNDEGDLLADPFPPQSDKSATGGNRLVSGIVWGYFGGKVVGILKTAIFQQLGKIRPSQGRLAGTVRAAKYRQLGTCHSGRVR